MARRKSREILEHGVRRVASQGESWRFLGKSRELAFGFAGVKVSAGGRQGMQGLGFGKSRELLLSLAVGKDRRYKVLCLGIMELVLIAAVYYAANWNLIKESTGVAGRLSLRHVCRRSPLLCALLWWRSVVVEVR